MSKIICDICGTTYQETAECCPICGCTRESAADLLGDNLVNEEVMEETKVKAGIFAPKKKKEIFDYDEVNAEPDDEEYQDTEDDSYDEEEEEEDAPRHNTVLVILLTILIACLLIAAGFVFVRYFLPNMKAEETIPVSTTAAVAEVAEETTEPTIPCQTIVMASGAKAELNEEGQFFLLHIVAKPENTTDKIIYTSGDESIATVSEDGRITAVSEGETTIYISCGKSTLTCPVVVKYVEETVPPATEPVVMEETIPPETAAPANSNVVLKLKQVDIMLGVYYSKQLELDCDLALTDVQWTSEHPHIATVDENGLVTAVKSGTTGIIAKYGDQEVQCIVRCG